LPEFSDKLKSLILIDLPPSRKDYGYFPPAGDGIFKNQKGQSAFEV
jgi:hypothetical protein